MSLLPPFNLRQWIDDHRALLKPPVGNQQIYKLNEDFIVMVVGGPNARKDYHYNEGEELFYQLEGDIVVKVKDGDIFKDISIKQGEMFLLPPKTPHCPQRPANSIGLVIERYRKEQERDGFFWYCEQCGNELYHEYFPLTDIVTQLPVVMKTFYSSTVLRTCTSCGHVMQPPVS